MFAELDTLAHGLDPEMKPVGAVVDLFSGAGGLGLGFRAQGFTIVWAADAFSAAVETYRANIGEHVKEVKLDRNTTLPPCDIVIGGPPCQGFSSAGLRKPGDARNTLVAVFGHLVARHRPKAFVFENVEGFLTGEGGRWVTDLLDPLVNAGYCIHLRKVNAANYGVPQHRKRVLAIGGLGWDPGFPKPTHRATGAPGADLVTGDLPFCDNVTKALDGLPPATDDLEAAIISDHFSHPPNEMDRLRFEALGIGQTMKDIPEELWHETYRRRAFRRVKDGTPTERRGRAFWASSARSRHTIESYHEWGGLRVRSSNCTSQSNSSGMRATSNVSRRLRVRWYSGAASVAHRQCRASSFRKRNCCSPGIHLSRAGRPGVGSRAEEFRTDKLYRHESGTSEDR